MIRAFKMRLEYGPVLHASLMSLRASFVVPAISLRSSGSTRFSFLSLSGGEGTRRPAIDQSIAPNLTRSKANEPDGIHA